MSEYLQRGDRVFTTCRHPSKANRLRELRGKYGEAVTILPMDVTDPQQIAACHAEVARWVEALHHLINNAGIFRSVERLDQVEMRDLLESFQVNAVGR